MHSIDRKPKFDLNSVPLAIDVSVHYDTGKFQHSCKDTKMAFLQLDFQGPLPQEVDNISKRVENER